MTTFGIDFGTSNSAVAVHFPETNEIVSSPYEGTLLYFEEKSPPVAHIGQKAIEGYLSNEMKGRFMKSLKSLLSFSLFNFTNIYGTKYFSEDLVALILTHLKEKGIKIAGAEPDAVVIGRPAHFSPIPEKDALAQARLLKAAQKAGFKDIRFQLEPIAAAYSYEHELQKEEIVFVGDLGGGTSDFTIMRLGPKSTRSVDRKKDILGTDGRKIGGDDFDAAITWHKVVTHLGKDVLYNSDGRGKMMPVPKTFYNEFCKWERHFLLNTPAKLIDLRKYHRWAKDDRIQDFVTVIENNLGFSLFKSIEQAKITLSEQDEAQISFDRMGVSFTEKITIDEFETILSPHLKKLSDCIDGLLAKADLKPGDVDAVFLTGGSSLARPVRKMFADKFSGADIKEKDTFNSVVKGLALS